ncbi:MAG: gluconate 2-dehydrogenase subunit 3 family protein [Acidobacteriota bacterium]|nr:gluconate 2-dehydrogenase subunit 3 family protein [Acidobacteriota bacterium]MDQ3417762.1 gluconate 2-dehydrogenase subunit 3 family protein [Acidobacteriota bacterium]
MATINRRRVLQLLGAAPLAAGFVWTETEVLEAQQRTQQARRAPVYKPSFFTAHEFATVMLLAEIIIPKDERSAGAAEAGVPQFMDFMMLDQPARQVPMRGGLAWLDQESNSRFNTTFRASTEAQRTAILDDISGLDAPSPDLSHGIAFFRSFRDLVATGFWTSKIGIADLQFSGNVFVMEWKGCPEEALKKLGLE